MIAPLLFLAALGTLGDGGAPPADAGQPDASGGIPDAGDGAALAAPAAPPANATPAPAAAPPVRLGVIAGRVLAKGSRVPVVAAAITVDLTPMPETGSAGDFAAEVPCGLHHIIVQAPGFQTFAAERDPCADPSPLLIRLVPSDGIPTYQTVIRARNGAPAVNVAGPELTKTPGTLGDPFRAIESLPGVATVAWPAPVYAVRGANPGNTGFFLDDLRVPTLFHLGLGPAVVHPYFFDGIDFYPGGYPARHGRYVAGIVSARSAEPASDMVHASVDVRLYDAGGLVSGPLPGGGTVMAAARYSYTGEALSLLSSAVHLSYWDYQLRVDRAVGPVRFTLLALGSSDDLSFDASSGHKQTIQLSFQRVSLRASVPAAGGQLQASLAVGVDHSQAPLMDVYPLTLSSRSLIPRLAYRHSTAHTDFELGVEGELQRFAPLTAIMRPGTLDLASARDARLWAGYASLAVRAGPLVVTPELRLDSYAVGDTERADLGPRLSARLALDDRTSFTAAGGRFTQTPSLALQVPGAESFGLALYGLQSSWQGSAGVETRRIPGLTLTATGFVQRYVLTDLRDPTLSTEVDPLASDLLIRRDARSYGLELMLRRPPGERLYGWLAYTLSNSQRALGGGVIGPSDWDQRHILNLVLGYRIGRYTVGGRVHVNTGRPVLVAPSAREESFVRLPTFYEIDLRAERRILFDRFKMDVYVELVNATLSREVISYSPDTTNPGQLTANGFSIVIPSIGLHAEL